MGREGSQERKRVGEVIVRNIGTHFETGISLLSIVLESVSQGRCGLYFALSASAPSSSLLTSFHRDS